jgi:hypothetical protein
MLKNIVKRAVGIMGYSIIKSNSLEKRYPENAFQMPNPVADMVRLLGTTTSPVVFDVGAHHGYVSNEFREALPDAPLFMHLSRFPSRIEFFGSG